MESFAYSTRPTSGVSFRPELSPAEAEEQSRQKMKTLVSQSGLVFLDACAIRHPEFLTMMEHLLPIMQEMGGRRPCTNASVIKELKKHDQAELLHQIAKWVQEDRFMILGSRNDRTFADPTILNQIVLLRHRVDAILVVTNDYGLSDDLLAQQVEDSGTIRTVQINRYGYFSSIPPLSRRTGGGTSRSVHTSDPLIL